ncbi:MAG: amidohydrolase family protein [Bryobacteraceae bacterium]
MSLRLLDNGLIFDGLGDAPYTGSVLMVDGRIAAAGPHILAPAAERVDCKGLAIAPGFVDLHSHSDLQVLEDREEKSNQGVTRELVGNCGFSPYPCGAAEPYRAFAEGILAPSDPAGFASAADYLEAARQRSTRIAVHSLAGHGTLRTALFAGRQDALSAVEMDRMAGALDDSLAGGAAGFSTGLMYAPGSAAPFEELLRLCTVTARRGALYTTHMRSYSNGLVESVEEQIELARRAGCRLQISHLQAVGQKNWDKQRIALDRIEEARVEGVDVEFDIYPYQAGSTVLTQLLPQWSLEGGRSTMLARLRDGGERASIAREAEQMLAQRWCDVFVQGRHLEDHGRARGVEPVQAAIDLILEHEGAVTMISFNQSEENLRQLLTHPLCNVISDGFYVDGEPHPRLYGTFPFLLGGIVRERRWMRLEEAIHKITAQPAARLGLANGGTIRPGATADVTVFDPATVAGPATYDQPRVGPRGIVAVYRGGEPVMGAAAPLPRL